MKRNVLLGMLVSFVACAMSSCSQEQAVLDDGRSVPVVLLSSLASTASSTKTSTANKGTATTWELNDSIGVYMGSLAENVCYVATSLADDARSANFYAGSGTAPIYFPQDGGEVKFIAYYPYSASIVNSMLAVDVGEQANPAAIDVLYSNTGTSYTKLDPNVELSFTHVMSRLQINIAAGTGMTVQDLKGMTVAMHGMPTRASFSLTDAVFTDKSGETESIEGLSPSDGQGAQFILIPQIAQEYTGRTVVFRLPDGSDYTWNVPDDFCPASGVSYQVNVSILKTGVTTDAIQIADWIPTLPLLHCYQVGDVYPFDYDDAKLIAGVVFSITNGGANGKIVSLDEARLLWSIYEVASTTYGSSSSDGWGNTKKIIAMGVDWETKYPAAAWCVDRTAGGLQWYMPAANDLLAMSDSLPSINSTLAGIGGTKLGQAGYYSSSTELSGPYIYTIDMLNGVEQDQPKWYASNYRAIAAF